MTFPRIAIIMMLFVLNTAPALAAGRFERGKNLVQQRCAPCRAMGWIWAPSMLDAHKPPDLAAHAKSWTPAQVCTWMHKQPRKVRGPACYPGAISTPDRLDMLYYQYRRAKGPILRPKLQRTPTFRLYRGKPLKRTLAERRATVEKQRRAVEVLQQIRNRTRSPKGTQVIQAAPKPPASRSQGRR